MHSIETDKVMGVIFTFVLNNVVGRFCLGRLGAVHSQLELGERVRSWNGAI